MRPRKDQLLPGYKRSLVHAMRSVDIHAEIAKLEGVINAEPMGETRQKAVTTYQVHLDELERRRQNNRKTYARLRDAARAGKAKDPDT